MRSSGIGVVGGQKRRTVIVVESRQMGHHPHRLHWLRSTFDNLDHLSVANAKFDTVFGDPWINLWVFRTIEDHIDHVGLAGIEHFVDALGDSGIGQFVWEADFNFNGGDLHGRARIFLLFNEYVTIAAM
jgi:hypothetical protein